MALVETIILSLLVVPVAFFIVLVFVLAALGKSLGFRRKYVQLLLRVFEYGRKRIEKARKLERPDEDAVDESLTLGKGRDTLTGEISPRGDSNANNKKFDNIQQQQDQDSTNVIKKSPSTLSTNGSTDGSVDDEDEDEEVKTRARLGRSVTLEGAEIFDFQDSFEFIRSGISAIVEDQVTQRFVAEELKSWNLLTRTNRHYEFISWRLSLVWVLGFFIRYFFLLPFRVTICFLGTVTLTVLTFFIGLLPEWGFRKRLNNYASKFSFRLLSRAFSAIVTYHCEENRPTKNGICVANHTSPIDVVLLACDSTYAMIGQRHGGFLGILQRALARASSHIWFERSEMKDRESVAKRLKQHVEDTSTSPILIFPEGTCINNSAVMQFKKGSFEVGGLIYPVAIKYDPRFGDPYWDSSQYSMLQYLYMMMTSWAIVCDVWYLPPMSRKPGESSIDFANRVKAEIARKGGLVDLDWDGQLKRAPAKKEWKEQQQIEYAKKFTLSPRHIVSTGDDQTNDSPNPST